MVATLLSAGRRGRGLLLLTVVFEITAVVGGYFAYSAVRVLVAGQEAAAISHGRGVLAAEQALHLAFERPAQAATLHAPWLVRFFDFYYLAMYLPFISMTVMYLFVRRRATYVRVRRTFLISGAAGLVIFALFPVAPPRLLPGAGFADTIHLYLPQAGYSSHSVANQFAAIPSFHFGWSTLAAWCLWQDMANRPARAALCVVPPLMLVTIVVTGNHLWIDAAVGLLVVVAAYQLASLPDRGTRRPGTAEARPRLAA